MNEIEATIQVLKEQKASYIPYILTKLKDEDFHAVSDAAVDIQCLQAKIDGLQMILDSEKSADSL